MTSVAPAAENTGRGSPNRMRNLERAIIRQSPNKATDSSKVVPNQQHAGKTTVSPDNKQQATVIVKKPSPGLEKQIHRTNAELRNTKKIVQVCIVRICPKKRKKKASRVNCEWFPPWGVR